jgi:DEAD/DEAH box helicase domain-containing protein
MNVDDFLGQLQRRRGYVGQICHRQKQPARPARFAPLSEPLPTYLARALGAAGLTRFYTHQAEAINAIRAGEHVVLSTAAASGKTLAYNLPVLWRMLEEPRARALYLFPTKALAQDQLRALRALAGPALPDLLIGAYDGDTPQAARARLRKAAGVILTNPDMLHVGILPNHTLWADFLSRLRYVVIDEAHAYRGVFGSQVACVLRRLRRLCAFYGSNPQFIFCSATIANPAEHTAALAAAPARVIADDGAPRGPRQFVLWNPPFIDRTQTARRSANAEAAFIQAELAGAGVRHIIFTRSRRVAELLLLYVRRALRESAPGLANRIKSYRAGYLADQRRQIERELFDGELLGVTATNALELGIDVGGLDAVVLVGYPGSIASTQQQAGRAGREKGEALAVLVGRSDPLDQYLLRHPAALLERTPEHALIAPDNPYILARHLPCAAHELPLSNADEALFGPGFVQAMIGLEDSGVLEYRNERWFYRGAGQPAQGFSLRSASGSRVALLDESAGNRMIEELDLYHAPAQVHAGAIYLHQGESYLVTQLDLDQRYALARPAETDYYTQPREVNDVAIIRSQRHQSYPFSSAYYGQARVTEQVIGFRRLQQFSDTVLDEEMLEMPAQAFETAALWFDLPAEWRMELAQHGLDFHGGLHAMEHAMIAMLPLFAMCDRTDIGGLSTPAHPDTELPQIFIYDAFPGGVGIAEKGFELLPALWRETLRLIEECPCEDGCPSCVYSPKCGNNNQPLDKAAARQMLRWLIGRG